MSGRRRGIGIDPAGGARRGLKPRAVATVAVINDGIEQFQSELGVLWTHEIGRLRAIFTRQTRRLPAIPA